jgi:hypothetical protein
MMRQEWAGKTAQDEAAPAHVEHEIRKLDGGEKLMAEGKAIEEVSCHVSAYASAEWMLRRERTSP